MPPLGELAQELASAVVLAEPSDLPALAQAHDRLLAIEAQADHETGLDEPRRQAVRASASTAEKLIEQIILREVDDATAALRQVGQNVAQILDLIHGKAAPSLNAELPSAGLAPAAAPSQAAAPAPAAEMDLPINPDDVPLVMEFITESLGHIESAEAAVLKLEEAPEDIEVISAIFRGFHTIKGVAGFLNLKKIGSLAHAAENVLDLARKGKLRLEGAAVDVVLESIDLMKVMISGLNEAAKSTKAPCVPEGLPALLSRLHLVAQGQAATPSAAATPPVAAPPQEMRPIAAAPETSTDAQAKPSASAATSRGASASSGDATVKVATDRLDALINMVGELVIAQSMARQDAQAVAAGNQRLVRNMAHLGKITRELQDLSMSMRMVPIQGVFQKMARVVRDLARKAGKEVELVTVGGETELDRNVVEAISDPLVHMVRNSVDHGIEPPEQRLAAGKSRAGRLELRAYHQAGNIVIEITDDGRGLNKAKILKKALEAGIIKEGQELAEAEIFKLIFHAGLSTAEKVTDVSGRGVGMDVVRRNVEALRGRIDIVSTEGKGSTFTIRLPLTLAVIDGQVVMVGSQRYIVPLTSIEQSIQPKPEQVTTVQGRGEMVLVQEELLPLFRVHRLFSVKADSEDPTKALVVVVRDDHKRCGILVDQLLGQQQVVIKSLGEDIGRVPGISGGAILGDGNVSLILDVPGLMRIAAGTHSAEET